MKTRFKQPVSAALLGAIAVGSFVASPLIANAAPTSAKVTVNGKAASNGVVINGVPYVRATDAANMAGLKATYNAASKTIAFSKKSTGNGSVNIVGIGGTTQRSGNEGKFGQLLVTPIMAIQLNKGVVEDQYGKSFTVFRGIVRNTSQVARYYEVGDAIVVTKAGDTVKYTLQANEVGNSSLINLQRGEQTKLQVSFADAGSEIDRVVITMKDYSFKKEEIFRIRN
jgi:hypothetical protein